jgi:hypothetical protein
MQVGPVRQYVGRILRSHENKPTAEVPDYLDKRTGVLAAMLAKRAPGYTSLGFPDPRKLTLTPSASTDSWPVPEHLQGEEVALASEIHTPVGFMADEVRCAAGGADHGASDDEDHRQGGTATADSGGA